MSKKPVVLMILDGYGLNKTHEGNAVYEAKKPVMDRLMKECPFVEGQAADLLSDFRTDRWETLRSDT